MANTDFHQPDNLRHAELSGILPHDVAAVATNCPAA